MSVSSAGVRQYLSRPARVSGHSNGSIFSGMGRVATNVTSDAWSVFPRVFLRSSTTWSCSVLI
jgi:hypothetical protein